MLPQPLNVIDRTRQDLAQKGKSFDPLTLESFLSEIMEIPSHKMTLDWFKSLVSRLKLSQGFLDKYTRFQADKYASKLVLRSDEVEILVCCWQPGQTSGVHNHKAAALNVTRVLRGTITEELYEQIGEDTILKQAMDRKVGELATTERYQYHQLVNNSDSKAVTLHFYTPARPE